MAQKILQQDLAYLTEPLVVSEEGKTAFEIFTAARNGSEISAETLKKFTPIINRKTGSWDDIVNEGDLLQVLPQIAGGF